MSFAKIWSIQTLAMETNIISVEIDTSRGLHAFSIIGLCGKLIGESRDRISSAIKNSGFISPKQRNQKITISLGPPHIKKEGTSFDLAMALAYLLAQGEVQKIAENIIIAGELSLDGKIKSLKNIISIIQSAKKNGFEEIIIPSDNSHEASLIEGIKIIPASNLREIVAHLNGIKYIKPLDIRKYEPGINKNIEEDCFKKIIGNEQAKRGMIVAVTGHHNVALWGTAGSGKTMLAKSAESICPPLNIDEALEVSDIHSYYRSDNGIISFPPFRSPHHSSSYTSIIGGGSATHPGEISFAHRGILFLDEFLQFDRRVIESLREPLEEKEIRISRTSGTTVLPSDIMLIIAMNPCPCGYYGSKSIKKRCFCSRKILEQYKNKLSGPIIDRIDIWIEMSETNNIYKREGIEAMDNIEVMEKIIKAREFSKRIDENEPFSEEIHNLLNKIVKDEIISTRGIKNVMKVARTIANLELTEKINKKHLLEALQYRKQAKLN